MRIFYKNVTEASWLPKYALNCPKSNFSFKVTNPSKATTLYHNPYTYHCIHTYQVKHLLSLNILPSMNLTSINHR